MQQSLDQLQEAVLDSLRSISPEKIISDNGDLGKFLANKSYYLVAVGKGSAHFAKATAGKYPSMVQGFVIDIEKTLGLDEKIDFLVGDHPLPSLRNMDNSQELMEFVKNIPEDGLIVTVICGGTSALLIDPINSLEQTIDIYKQLLLTDISINDMNTVRKHLDNLKGGGLAKLYFPRQSLNLYVCDVPGNDLSAIGSGPTVFDKSTISDAQAVLNKAGINIENIKLVETPKDNQIFAHLKNQILVSAEDLLENLKTKFPEPIYIGKEFLSDDQDKIIQKLKELLKKNYRTFIFSGESKLKVTGNGQGGRCSHLALKILSEIDDNLNVISLATDGHDNSEAAGASFNTKDLKIKDQEIQEALDNFDSYTFFKKYDSLILTDNLPVNLSDLLVISNL